MRLDGATLQIRAHPQDHYRHRINLYVDAVRGREVVAVGQPIEMREARDDDRYSADLPIISIFPDAAQQLMDDLWRCGVRPTEGCGSTGQLDAVRSHLADLRAIVFDKLKVPKP